MKNNEIILAFIKENLGNDLNENYNELGCAQTVNNILKFCLGYQAGGGPSTAKMLQVIVANPDFKEVTKITARPGDIVLSATGTGNGNIAHGHVGFLGENGVIYSNNSYTDKLDGHITAAQWKSYFKDKGGFSVRYFRAIGDPKIDWKPTPKIPVVLQSSQDPNKVSLTVKASVGVLIGYLAQKAGVQLSTEEITLIQNNILVIAPALAAILGVVRKFIK